MKKLLVLLALTFSLVAHAWTPTKPITVVVPNAPGAGNEIAFRILAKQVEKNKNINFVKINVDEAQELSNEYKISSIPCIIFFKEGKEADRMIGAVGEARIEEKIRTLQSK